MAVTLSLLILYHALAFCPKNASNLTSIIQKEAKIIPTRGLLSAMTSPIVKSVHDVQLPEVISALR